MASWGIPGDLDDDRSAGGRAGSMQIGADWREGTLEDDAISQAGMGSTGNRWRVPRKAGRHGIRKSLAVRADDNRAGGAGGGTAAGPMRWPCPARRAGLCGSVGFQDGARHRCCARRRGGGRAAPAPLLSGTWNASSAWIRAAAVGRVIIGLSTGKGCPCRLPGGQEGAEAGRQRARARERICGRPLWTEMRCSRARPPWRLRWRRLSSDSLAVRSTSRAASLPPARSA